ncbi:MAG: hypothetical protein ACW97O_09645 [Candidatus Thorarchaeota archaeon]|jgi:hypothetical protein
MKKWVILFVAAVMTTSLCVTPVFAGIGSEIPDKGEHYNLNIIGVPHGKKADMTDSNRHTIFVPLGKDGDAKSCRIFVVRNVAEPDKFQVLDGNAFDGSATVAVPFEDYGILSFNVYSTALGKPGGKTDVTANVTFDEGTYGSLLMGSFQLKRGKGKPKPVDISDIFRASGWIDVDESGDLDPSIDTTFTNVWVFNVPTLLEYLWDYSNQGLKLMQIRFYPTTSGSWTNIPQ